MCQMCDEQAINDADDGTPPNRPWADPSAPGNELRPNIKCIGCGKLGCVTYWGPWCFDCNVKRMDWLDKSMSDLARAFGIDSDQEADGEPQP